MSRSVNSRRATKHSRREPKLQAELSAVKKKVVFFGSPRLRSSTGIRDRFRDKATTAQNGESDVQRNRGEPGLDKEHATPDSIHTPLSVHVYEVVGSQDVLGSSDSTRLDRSDHVSEFLTEIRGGRPDLPRPCLPALLSACKHVGVLRTLTCPTPVCHSLAAESEVHLAGATAVAGATPAARTPAS